MSVETKDTGAAKADGPEGGDKLAGSVRQALVWSAGLSLFRDLMQFLQMIVLVRLLDPSIYGVAALGYSVTNFLGMASFQHFASHIIQVRDEKKIDYHLFFTFGLLLNGSLFVIANLIAFGVSFFAAYAELQPVLHVLSLTFLLSVPGDLRQRMLERNHQWLRLRPMQMAAIVVSLAAGIALAMAGTGVYALIVPGMSVGLVFTIDLLVIAGWRPQWRWVGGGFRDALAFGVNRAASNALNGGRKLLEGGLIADNFRFGALGVFGRAEGIGTLFCGRIAQQALSSLYPIITRIEPETPRFRRVSGLVMRAICWIVLPMGSFLAIEAASVTDLLYGSKWATVAPLLPLAMAVAVLQAIASAAYSLLLANEQRSLCLRSDVVAFLLCCGTSLWLVPHGVIPYLWGGIAANAAIACVLLGILARTNGIGLAGLASDLAAAALCTLIASACLALAAMAVPKDIPLFVTLCALGIGFGVGYIGSLRVFYGREMQELFNFVPAGNRLSRLFRLRGPLSLDVRSVE